MSASARARILSAIAFALVLTPTPAPAQKTFIWQCTGSAILLKAGGTAIKALGLYPVGFGDIIATGNDGSAELATNSGFRATLAPGTVVTFVRSGPLATSRDVIELVTGAVSFSDSGNGLLSPSIAVDGTETKASAEVCVATAALGDARAIADLVGSIESELARLEPEYDLATERLRLANDRYRDLLAAGSEADGPAVAAFREAALFPAEDGRSAVLGEIARRETLLRAIRLFVLAPRYMREKSAHPNE